MGIQQEYRESLPLPVKGAGRGPTIKYKRNALYLKLAVTLLPLDLVDYERRVSLESVQ